MARVAFMFRLPLANGPPGAAEIPPAPLGVIADVHGLIYMVRHNSP